jgi:hypothetical protein
MRIADVSRVVARLTGVSAILYAATTFVDAHDGDCHHCTLDGGQYYCVHNSPTGGGYDCFAVGSDCTLWGDDCSG